MGTNQGKGVTDPVRMERWLVSVACLIVAAAWLISFWRIADDRELTHTASARVAQSIALSLEEHVVETTRDASNALVSAALLIEQAGGPRGMSIARMQHELDRELPDKTSVKRLVVIDKDANTVATSDARQLASIRVPQREFYVWHAAHPTDTSVHLSQVVRTKVQKEWVIPLSRAIIVKGRFEGLVVAQLDAHYFEAFYRKLTTLYPAALTLANADGKLMFRYPFKDAYMGEDVASGMDWPKILGSPGMMEHISKLDGQRRFVSHRAIAGWPLVVLVGLDHDVVMAPWHSRTRQLVLFVAAGSVLFICLVALLVANLRRFARSEARFRGLYNVANDGILVLRGETIIDVNPACLGILGYAQPSDMVGHLPGEFYPEGNEGAQVRIRDRLKLVAAGEKARFEVVLRRSDGNNIIVELSLTSFENEDEILVMALMRDITERKRTEDDLKKLTAELETRIEQRTAQLSATLREMKSFSYTVSHDLRAPVRHMRSYSAAIREDFAAALPADCRRMLERIDLAGERMDELITGLLALSKVSRDALSVMRCDLSAMAQAAAATLREIDPASKAVIEIEPGLAVEADRGMLQALLGNLLGNAWKFSAKVDAPRIELGSVRHRGKAVFFVRDNGVGFNMDYAKELFEPFRRLHGAGEFQGTGIGLATVHRIIERHGGSIEAESAPGEGTTFYFSLGAAEPAIVNA